MKKYFDFFKSFTLAPFIIYIFDRMAVILDIFIPVNAFTVLIIGFFGIMGLVLLIVVYLIIL